MSIHDAIFFAGSIVLCAALVPAVYGKIETPLWTSLALGLVLAAFAVNYATLGFVFTTVATAVQALLWGVVASRGFKKWRFERRKKRSWYASWHTPTKRFAPRSESEHSQEQ